MGRSGSEDEPTMSLFAKSQTDAPRTRTDTSEALPEWALDDSGAPLVVADGHTPAQPAKRRARLAREVPGQGARVEYIEVERLDPNPFQPRRFFDQDELNNLGASLLEIGQLQPILVRPHPKRAGRYQLIAGERRWRAARPLGHALPKLLCVVRPMDELEVLSAAWHENNERVGVRPFDSANFMARYGLLLLGYDEETIKKTVESGELPEDFPYEAVAKKTNMSARSVRRYTDLLVLPPAARAWFDKAAPKSKSEDDAPKSVAPTEKHGRALLLLRDNPRAQSKLRREIETERLSGDAAIERAKKHRDGAKPSPINASANASANASKSPTAPPSLARAVELVESATAAAQSGALENQDRARLSDQSAALAVALDALRAALAA